LPRLAVVVSHPIQHFTPLYRELAGQGTLDLRVLFCCDWGVSAYHDPAFDRVVEWDVPLLEGYAHEFLPIARRPRSISFLEVDNPVVGERLDAFVPDVVLVHGYGCRTMWRAVSWARRRGALAMLSSDSHAGRSTPAWKRALKGAVVGAFYRKLDGALAAGESNGAYHRRYGLPAERIFPFVLPVDGERLRARAGDMEEARRSVRDALGIPLGAVVALFCGNLTPWKRPTDFATAVARASALEPAVHGVVVGDGPERAAVEAIASGPGGAKVRLAGFVNQSDIGRYYAAADVLVLTSERDAHPLVVTEGLFFGLPVVLTDRIGCVGPGETAQPGRNAFVFPCGDVGQLAEMLVDLARNAGKRSAAGQESRAISATQDASDAARLVGQGVSTLVQMGPRHA
jgi:glycosyltransferase involved in cell wall biosynthesis